MRNVQEIKSNKELWRKWINLCNKYPQYSFLIRGLAEVIQNDCQYNEEDFNIILKEWKKSVDNLKYCLYNSFKEDMDLINKLAFETVSYLVQGEDNEI